jgi:sugar lactone lactonase YvrE
MSVQEFPRIRMKLLTFFVLLMITVLSMVQGGCATTAPRAKKFPYVFYPAPPDEPRYQFLTSYSGEKDFGKRKRSGLAEHVLGVDEPEEFQQMRKPYGIAMHDGKVYVCDTKRSAVDVLDLVNERFSTFGLGPAGKLITPAAIYVDDDGKKYVADVGWNRVLIYDEQDQYYGALGDPKKLKPVDLVIIGDDVLIVDYLENEIEIWNKKTQRYEGALGESIGKKVVFGRPVSIAKDSKNNLYVVETGKFQVTILDEEGHFIRSFGQAGDTFGQFARPKGIALDKEGRIYVVDSAFGNVQVFDSNGALLTYIEGPGDERGPLVLPASVTIDYANVELFKQYVNPDYNLDFVILVASQFGPLKVSVYGYVTKKG